METLDSQTKVGKTPGQHHFNFIQIRKLSYRSLSSEEKAARAAKLRLWRKFKTGVDFRFEGWHNNGDEEKRRAILKGCRTAFERALARAKDGKKPTLGECYEGQEAWRVKGPVMADRWGCVIYSPARYGFRVAKTEAEKVRLRRIAARSKAKA